MREILAYIIIIIILAILYIPIGLTDNNMSIMFGYGESMNSSDMHLFNQEYLPVIPTMSKYNISFIRIYSQSQLEVGDIITYHSTRFNKNIVHRIVRKNGPIIVAQGDNNPYPDPEITQADVLATVVRFPDGVVNLFGVEVPLVRVDFIFISFIFLLLVAVVYRRVKRYIYG